MFVTLSEIATQTREALIRLDGPDTTAQDVYERLLAGDYKGMRDEGSECPVANYLKDVLHLPNGVTLSVMGEKVELHRSPVVIGYEKTAYGHTYGIYAKDLLPGVEVAAPDSIRDFVRQFDDGDFEELDVSSSDEEEDNDDDYDGEED